MKKLEMYYKLINECATLTNSEYRVMTVLIMYSKDYFANISYNRLVEHTNLGEKTIYRAIRSLTQKNCIKNISNNTQKACYELIYFNSTSVKMTEVENKNVNSTSVKMTEVENQLLSKRHKTSVKMTEEQHNNNNREREENIYQKQKNQLKLWGISETQIDQIFQMNDISKICTCIEITANKAKYDRGAYFLRLISNTDKNILEAQNIKQKNENNRQPESNIICDALKHLDQVKKINEPKPSRTDIIEQLLRDGKTEEAENLKRIFRVK